MAALDFILSPRDSINVLIFDHGTGLHSIGMKVLDTYAKKNPKKSINVIEAKIDCEKPKRESLEEHWRNQRIKFLTSVNYPVITGHNLDDCVETWLWSASHGSPRTIPYRNQNIIRPFLLTRKEVLVDWCKRKNIEYITDVTNFEEQYMRGCMRTNVIPGIMKINPGIHKSIRRVVLRANPPDLVQI